jgi:transcriptional regulator with XRE-family HTH domain
MTTEQLGERIKKIRLHLGLSQAELAKAVYGMAKPHVKQNLISRIERGFGSIELLLLILTYYSKFIYIDNIFSSDAQFEIIKYENYLHKNSGLNTIIKAKLDLLKESIASEIDNVKDLL